MSRIIECQVNDEYILGSGVPIGAAGSFGDVILRLTFNEMWDGLSIVATFKDAQGVGEKVVMLLPSMLIDGEVRTYDVPIPSAAKAVAGRAKLTLSGYSVYTVDEDNGERIVKKDSLTNTATAFFRVLESESAIVDDESVDATMAEYMLSAINEISSKNVEWAKDESKRQDAEEGRNEAELQRQIAELGAVGNYYDKDYSVVRDLNGNFVENEYAGRVGAEKNRDAAEKKRDAAEKKRDAAEIERNAKIFELEIMVGEISAAVDAILDLRDTFIGGEE